MLVFFRQAEDKSVELKTITVNVHTTVRPLISIVVAGLFDAAQYNCFMWSITGKLFASYIFQKERDNDNDVKHAFPSFIVHLFNMLTKCGLLISHRPP